MKLWVIFISGVIESGGVAVDGGVRDVGRVVRVVVIDLTVVDVVFAGTRLSRVFEVGRLAVFDVIFVVRIQRIGSNGW